MPNGFDRALLARRTHAPAINEPIKASAHTPMITTIAQPIRLANQLLTCRPMIARLLPTRMIIAINGGAVVVGGFRLLLLCWAPPRPVGSPVDVDIVVALSIQPCVDAGSRCEMHRSATSKRSFSCVIMPGMSLRTRAASAWRVLGPGFVTGSSDDDPSGIQTYSQTGAQFGYTQLWLAAWAYPFMAAIQEICGRIGMVTGRGLASVLRE